MFHATAGIKTKSELKKIPVHAPSGAGNFYVPVSHWDVAEAVDNSLQRLRIKTYSSKYWVEGDVSCGLLVLSVPNAKGGDRTCIGWTNRNTGRHRSELFLGVDRWHGVVLAGTNLPRHTVRMDIQTEITEHLGILLNRSHGMIERLSKTHVEQRDLDSWLMKAARSKIIPWSKAGLIDSIWNNPPNPSMLLRTQWSLLGVFSIAVHTTNPEFQMSRKLSFLEILLS